MTRSVPVPPFVGPGMVTRRIVLRAKDVVFLKGIIEASDGLAQVFAERGGELTIAAPLDRASELDEVIDALCEELGALSVQSHAEPIA